MNIFLKACSAAFLISDVFLTSASSKDIKYKASDIPVELVSDAKAVVRNRETVFEISDINKIVKKVTYAITILNEKGIENSVLAEFYNKFITVRKIKADLFDQIGIPIKNNENVKVEGQVQPDKGMVF